MNSRRSCKLRAGTRTFFLPRVHTMAHDFCFLLDAKRYISEEEYDVYSTTSRDASSQRLVVGLGLSRDIDLNLVCESLRNCKPVEVSKIWFSFGREDLRIHAAGR